MTNLAPTTHQPSALPQQFVIPAAFQRDLHTLSMQQQRTMTELRTVKRCGALTEQALRRHVRRLEWMLCAAFAMLCLLMVTVGLLWRAMP